MSPVDTRISNADIVLVARRMVKSRGVDGFTLRDVAQKLRLSENEIFAFFEDKTSLLQAVKEGVLGDMVYALQNSVLGFEPPASKIFAICRAYRNFAKKQPELFQLIYNPILNNAGNVDVYEVCDPLVSLIGQIYDDHNAISASRFLASFMYGFCTMELNGSYKIKGCVEEVFDYSINSYVFGLQVLR